MSEFKLTAQLRADNEQGKGASRRLRRENRVPAIVYGGESAPLSVTLRFNEIIKALENEAFFASLITLDVNGQTEEVIIKALQRHPAKGFPMHADFMRVVRGQTMHFTVPVHYIGEAVGVQEGGVLTTNVTDVEITCLPRQLPQALDVDVSGLSVGDALRLSDIQLPDGISITQLDSEGTDRVIVSVQPPVVEQEISEAEEAEDLEQEVAPDEVPATELGGTSADNGHND